MNHSRKIKGLTAVAAALLAASGMAAAAPEVCVACHNDNGVTTDPMVPTLAGNAAFFTENQLFMFADEMRPCAAEFFAGREGFEGTDHCAAVADLSEDDIVEIGAHYEELPYVPFEQEVDAALAATGKALHDDGCARCHSDGGSVMEDEAGILAGQPKPYMIEQMKFYREGERQPQEMIDAMEGHSDEDIVALAEYYASEASRF